MNTRDFQQSCPVCGRLVRIDKSLKFTTVVCQHCGGNFSATGEELVVTTTEKLPGARGRKIDALLCKSDRLLCSKKLSFC
ncbi:MAG TPA: hypothetical protein DDZ24_01815 [Planctomycetaceae bacterium]|jgi:hypothetical protein|nr:hypothetical protein [Planctomycetaceae bacterium]